MLKLNSKRKLALKKVIIFWVVIMTALLVKVFIIGNDSPSPDKGTVHNMLLSANVTPTPDPVLAELEAQYEQEKLILQSQIDELIQKLNAAEKSQRDEIQKNLVIKAIDKHIGGVFANKGNYIYTTCKKYNVNPMLLAAIMRHETANGTSDVCKNANNPGGVNWYKNCGYAKYGWYQKYPSIEVGIDKMAKLIKENYIDQGRGDIKSIALKYAPPNDPRNGIGGMDNHAWPKFVTTIYLNILNDSEKKS